MSVTEYLVCLHTIGIRFARIKVETAETEKGILGIDSMRMKPAAATPGSTGAST